jgi:hypothetical protein
LPPHHIALKKPFFGVALRADPENGFFAFNRSITRSQSQTHIAA